VACGAERKKAARRCGGFVWDVGNSCDLLLQLDGEGFGEFEAEGGLGGQDNLLLPGIGCSRGSCTRTQCCADECAFATAGKSSDEGSAPAAAGEGRGTFFFSLRAKDAKTPILNLEQGHSVPGWGRMIFYVADVDAFWEYLRGKGFDQRVRATPRGASGISTCLIRMGMSCRSRALSSSLSTTA